MDPGGDLIVDARNSGPSPIKARIQLLLNTVDPPTIDDKPNPNSPFAGTRARFAAPLIVALVGSSSSGKSTLLNAMVSYRAAATDETECTRVVTMYQDGQPKEVDVYGLDGGMSRQPGVPPETYGRPADEIDYAMAYFPCDVLLHDYQLIDTPGLSTNTKQSELATRRALLGPTNMPKPDVVLFVTNDVDLLEEEKDFLSDIGATRRNTLFVVSCADRAGGNVFGTDPFRIAGEIADKLAAKHSRLAMDAIPVSGKLAYAGVFGVEKSDARKIADLPPINNILDWDTLLDDPPNGNFDDLAELQELVGQYGIVHGREHAAQGDVHFTDWLKTRSGIDALNSAIKTRFLRTVDVLKARTALEDIRSIADKSSQRSELRKAIDEARNDDALHPIRELEAVQLLTHLAPQSPLIGEFDEVGGITTQSFGLPAGAPAAEFHRAIDERIARCHHRKTSAPPAEQAALPVLLHSYLLLRRGSHDA